MAAVGAPESGVHVLLLDPDKRVTSFPLPPVCKKCVCAVPAAALWVVVSSPGIFPPPGPPGRIPPAQPASPSFRPHPPSVPRFASPPRPPTPTHPPPRAHHSRLPPPTAASTIHIHILPSVRVGARSSHLCSPSQSIAPPSSLPPSTTNGLVLFATQTQSSIRSCLSNPLPLPLAKLDPPPAAAAVRTDRSLSCQSKVSFRRPFLSHPVLSLYLSRQHYTPRLGVCLGFYRPSPATLRPPTLSSRARHKTPPPPSVVRLQGLCARQYPVPLITFPCTISCLLPSPPLSDPHLARSHRPLYNHSGYQSRLSHCPAGHTFTLSLVQVDDDLPSVSLSP